MASGSKKPIETPPVSSVKLDGNPGFRAEIEKSRAMIAGSDQEPAPAKNLGGRPSKAAKLAEAEALKAAQARDLEKLVPPAGLKNMVQLPFTLAAMQTGFAGWQLSEEEAAAIVPSLHTVLLTYAPQLQGESTALLALAASIFSVGLGKYVAFMQFKKQGAGAEEPPPQEPSAASAPASAPGTFFPPGMHIT